MRSDSDPTAMRTVEERWRYKEMHVTYPPAALSLIGRLANLVSWRHFAEKSAGNKEHKSNYLLQAEITEVPK